MGKHGEKEELAATKAAIEAAQAAAQADNEPPQKPAPKKATKRAPREGAPSAPEPAGAGIIAADRPEPDFKITQVCLCEPHRTSRGAMCKRNTLHVAQEALIFADISCWLCVVTIPCSCDVP